MTIPNSVTTIGASAFNYCRGLSSVTIPNSVTTIGDEAFEWCSGLTSVTIPNSVTTIGAFAFCGCSGLNSVTIPNSVTTIGGGAFQNCYGLKSIIIGNSVTTIGDVAFYNCSGLTSVTIPNSVTTIGNEAFYGCSDLNSVTILCKNVGSWFSGYTSIKEVILGDSVTTIGNFAFKGCNGLTSVTIPNSVTTIGAFAFAWCSGLNSVTIPNNVTTIGDEAFSSCNNLTSIILSDNITDIGYSAFEGCRNVLNVNRGTISLFSLWNRGYIPYEMGTENKLVPPSINLLSTTQTTAKAKIDNRYEEFTYKFNGEIFTDEELTLTGLKPEAEHSLTLTVSLDNTQYSTSQKYWTNSISPSISATKTASSISLKGSYIEGDAEVTLQEVTINGKTVDNNECMVTGLDPNKQYMATYSIQVNNENGDDWIYRKEIPIMTEPLVFKSAQPKVISIGNVIVSAQTNLDNTETNVGFEWRRTDWTEEFASNTGAAYLFNQEMEGYIRNLYIEKLWKFRPYYLSDSGVYHYGEWLGIDPTNTSYFEPTVHTYSDILIEGNTALIKGYALRGTDNITIQGFKYWKQDMNVKERNGEMVSVPNNAQTVEAKGQIMSANLTKLDYDSDYCYVAFVTTSEGETFYGEIQVFHIGQDMSGINDVLADAPTIIARYNMKGQRITEPQRGINILHMSDGTTRKVLVK